MYENLTTNVLDLMFLALQYSIVHMIWKGPDISDSSLESFR